MAISISRREVLNNLIRFKESLLEMEENERPTLQHERAYDFVVNRHTGDIRFVINKGMPEWEAVRLLAEDQDKAVHFRLKEKPIHLDPLAAGILLETLDVLNHLASLYHPVPQKLPENTVLEHLADLHISVTKEPIESMRGWSGYLSRIEAEKALSGSPPGSYLIRMGDQVIERVSEAFAKTNHTKVRLFVLTFVDRRGSVVEHLMMETQWGWTFVKDESDLLSESYEYHASASALIHSMFST